MFFYIVLMVFVLWIAGMIILFKSKRRGVRRVHYIVLYRPINTPERKEVTELTLIRRY